MFGFNLECIDFKVNDIGFNSNKQTDNLIAYVDHCFKVKNKGT